MSAPIRLTPTVSFRRFPHATHYQGGGGHDLEQWDVIGELPRGHGGNRVAPSDVPRNAEYHSGYLDDAKVQHWLFVRRAPLTGSCSRCAK